MTVVLLAVGWLVWFYLLIGALLAMYWLRKDLATPDGMIILAKATFARTFLGLLATASRRVLGWPWLLAGGRT